MRYLRSPLPGVLALALVVALLSGLSFAGVLALPWPAGGPAAEARTAVLSGGKFAPVAEPPGFHAPGGGSPLVSFQGVLTDPGTGLPVADGNYSITFRIFDAASGGNNLWQETQATVAVSAGLFSVMLGSVTPLTASAFDGTSRYLEVQVSPDPAMTPRLQFGYVPYAFQAEQAGALSRLGFSLTAVDTTGNVGAHNSVTIGADGLPVISYADTSNGDLKVVKCGNAACTAGNTITAVDSAGNVGTFSSVTIGVDGLPLIGYHDVGNRDLKVVKCGNAACTAGNTITTVDSTSSFVGESTSVTIGADGLPVMSYHDIPTRDLKVAHCGNAACSAGNTLTTVDSAGIVGQQTSMTIGTDGLPLISYGDGGNGDLKVVKCGNAACTAGNTITAVDSAGNVGTFSSVTIGAEGLPVISYVDETNGSLKVARCGDAVYSTACGVGGTTCTTVDSAVVGQGLQSVTMGVDLLPVISYFDVANGDLKVAHCGSAACDAGNSLTTVDSLGILGVYSSVTIGSDGLPVISYYDSTNGDLRVVHCSNRFCTPFHRPR